jgi:hypothetical protein
MTMENFDFSALSEKIIGGSLSELRGEIGKILAAEDGEIALEIREIGKFKKISGSAGRMAILRTSHPLLRFEAEQRRREILEILRKSFPEIGGIAVL